MQRFNSGDFARAARTNRTDLENELATNPANIAFYGEQAALWNAEAERLRTLREFRASEIYLDCKENLAKATDGFITATQKLDETYRLHDNKLNEAREQAELFEKALIALRAKQSSLGSLNAIQRLEHDATTSTLPRNSDAEMKARREEVVGAQR